MTEILLSPVEARVLGALVEKEMTTPEYYPLTLNALVAACNQSSNRDPVVSYDEATVTAGIEGLREKQLVRWVKEARSRAPKYRHDLASVPGLTEPERALVAVLLLRGPQTAGELRTRTERYYAFSDLGVVESMLEDLARRDEAVTERLERRPGQKEARWRLRWTPDAGQAAEPPGRAPEAASAPGAFGPPEAWPVRSEPPAEDQQTRLERQLAELRDRVDRLERELGLD